MYAANLWLTGGSNRALSAVSVALLTANAWQLLAMYVGRRANASRSILVGSIVCIWIFSPVMAGLIFEAFSGVVFLGANLIALRVLFVVVCSSKDDPPTRHLVAPGFAAVFTHTVAVLVWPAAILVAVLLDHSRRRVLGIALLGGTCALGCLLMYSSVLEHPQAD